MKKPYIIAITVVAVIIIVVVLALLFVPNIRQGIVGERVSIKQASLSWEYFYGKYHVKNVTVVLSNNGRDQLFNLYIRVEGNWPIEYLSEKGFDISVGAGLNPGETRTISDTQWSNVLMWGACTKQPGAYTVTFRVVKYNDPIVIREVLEVYGERTITTHVP